MLTDLSLGHTRQRGLLLALARWRLRSGYGLHLWYGRKDAARSRDHCFLLQHIILDDGFFLEALPDFGIEKCILASLVR